MDGRNHVRDAAADPASGPKSRRQKEKRRPFRIGVLVI
jgi:hypothetical protein